MYGVDFVSIVKRNSRASRYGVWRRSMEEEYGGKEDLIGQLALAKRG
jgi:hypothetical protein